MSLYKKNLQSVQDFLEAVREVYPGCIVEQLYLGSHLKSFLVATTPLKAMFLAFEIEKPMHTTIARVCPRKENVYGLDTLWHGRLPLFDQEDVSQGADAYFF